MIFIAGDYNTPIRNVKLISAAVLAMDGRKRPYNSGRSTFDSSEASVSSSLVSCINEAI